MEDPTVQLQSGLIRGLVEKHEDGFNYYAFKGIPYAEAPVGKLRFKDPKSKKSWTGVLDCKNCGPMCLQYDPLYGVESLNEDCLYLNVFSRSINSQNENLPVIFVIHGGAFVMGSSDDSIFGPEYFIRKNVVLVTINYRLGVLGFLNLEDEIAPGNQGIKDQLMALQWVQQNVRQFGGDPNNVTVMGLYAGGVTAHYLSLSPLSKGLIHKLIFHGSTIYNTWVNVKNPKSVAIQLCSLLGRQLQDSAEILEFLKTVDTKSLQQAQERLRLSLIASRTFPFGPGKDDKSPNPAMPIDPEIAANQGLHIPSIIGYDSAEGILALLGSTMRDYFQSCNVDFGKMLLYNASRVLQRYNLNENQVKQLYYQNDTISHENLEKFVEYVTDIYFIEGIHRFVEVQVKESSTETYLYKFSYETSYSMTRMAVKNAPRGCSHMDEQPYFFKNRALLEHLGIAGFEKGTRDYKLMEQVTEMWTNFAKYGKPTVDISELTPVNWPPVTDSAVLQYLNIDEDITMQSTMNIRQKLLAAKNL